MQQRRSLNVLKDEAGSEIFSLPCDGSMRFINTHKNCSDYIHNIIQSVLHIAAGVVRHNTRGCKKDQRDTMMCESMRYKAMCRDVD